MIQLSRNYSLPQRDDELITIKVVGVGGAGSNALDRIVLDGLEKAELIAMNTDAQSLASSVAAGKVQLGRSATHGLGAGGDPEVGYGAAAESADEIRHAVADARMVFICAGLGGGTGSGAAPVVAQLAREAGSLVIAFATMPFSFEGKRRSAQAQEALTRLHEFSDAVICFENDRMGDIVAPKAGIHQAFAAADVTISQSVRSIVNLMQRPGLLRVGFDDLLSALRNANGRCLFGFGESDSDNRAHDSLKQALKNPLMDRGRMLSEAAHVLVHVAGGPGMTLSEVEILMKDLGRHISDHTQILFGTAVDGRMGNRMSVTLISSLSAGEETGIAPAPLARIRSVPLQAAAPVEAPALAKEKEPEFEAPAEIASPQLKTIDAALAAPELLDFDESRREVVEQKGEAIEVKAYVPDKLADLDPAPAETVKSEAVSEPPIFEPEPEPVIAPQPRVILPRQKPVPPRDEMPPLFERPAIAKDGKRAAEKTPHAKQEVLQFEPVTRGRFEKSEPTIVEGQDLDVPTFLRKNVRVK